MYQHPLERLLIYTDKNSKEEFNLPKEIWNELYTLFVKTKYDVLEGNITAVDFFNEVFYLLTFTYANEDAAEIIDEFLYSSNPLCPPIPELANPQTKEDKKAAENYKEYHRNINGYILYFVWYILTKQAELPPHVEAFLVALDHLLENTWIFDFHASIFYDYEEEHPNKFALSFDMNPTVDINLLMRSTHEWKCATYDFDRETVNHIVMRFKDEDDRKQIIEEIRKHLAADNKHLPHLSQKVSMVTHRKKTTDASLDELLKIEIPTDNNTEQHPNMIITGGFVDYILHDQQKVLNVLMFISHLGQNQMPLMIKSIKALQSLGYIKKDCFETIDEFAKKAQAQFPDTNFDLTNVKKQIQLSNRVNNTEYQFAVQEIANHIELIIQS